MGRINTSTTMPIGIAILITGLSLPGSGQTALSDSNREALRTEIVEVSPRPSQITPLRLMDYFPKVNDEAEGVYFTQVQRMSIDSQSRILVTDLRTCQIFGFDPQGRSLIKLGRCGQGPGDLSFPGKAVSSADRIVVLDNGNGRISYFDWTGKFERSVRLAKTYTDFVAAEDGKDYALAGQKNQAFSIDAIGREGELLFSFGRLPDHLAASGRPLQAWLEMSPRGELFVAFWFAPIVQVYSPAGVLRDIFEIRYGPMQEKISRQPSGNRAQVPGGGRLIGESIIEGMFVAESGFYLLHRAPEGRVDILEFSSDGTFIRDYWVHPSADYYPRGLAIIGDHGTRTFYLLQAGPENRIDAFVAK